MKKNLVIILILALIAFYVAPAKAQIKIPFQTPEINDSIYINFKTREPFIPSGWRVLDNKSGSIKSVYLYLSYEQMGKNSLDGISGKKLRDELVSEKVVSASVLDYLLQNQTLIPRNWRGKYIFFWGTTYIDSNGFHCIRFLGWTASGWAWGYGWIQDRFNSNDYVAITK